MNGSIDVVATMRELRSQIPRWTDPVCADKPIHRQADQAIKVVEELIQFVIEVGQGKAKIDHRVYMAMAQELAVRAGCVR
jgi:hypothetical protein